jgi:hypothetical protein
MLFKNTVRTSKRTPHLTITEINWLTLFKETVTVVQGIIPSCSQNHTRPIIQKVDLVIDKATDIVTILKGKEDLIRSVRIRSNKMRGNRTKIAQYLIKHKQKWERAVKKRDERDEKRESDDEIRM